MINGMLPDIENYRNSNDWINGDTYKLLISMRSYQICDASLGLFENGLLLVYPRRNPYTSPIEELESLNLDYIAFRKNMDKLIPVLSFPEIHYWLTHSKSTRRFVRSLAEISQEELDRRKKKYKTI